MTKPHLLPFLACPSVPHQAQGQAQRGFTLVELVVAVSILAVLLTIGVSSFADIGTSMKLTSASNTLLAHIHHARSEAIKRNSRVVLCKSSDGAACAQTGGWEQGWIVFHDANNNALREDSEIIIQREPALASELLLTGNSHVSRYLSFAGSGATRKVGGSYQMGTLTLCRRSTQAGEARQIVFNAVGRPRVERATLDSCS